MILSSFVVLVIAVSGYAAPFGGDYYDDSLSKGKYDLTHLIKEKTRDRLLQLMFPIKALPNFGLSLWDDSSLEAELGEYFEGDILLTPAQEEAIQKENIERNGLKDSTKRWPNKTVIYHIIENDFDKEQIQMIKEGMKDLENRSCVKFRAREKDEHAVTIQGSQNGCFSSVGVTKNDTENENVRQVLNLASNCFRHGTIVHEMLHTLGFYHMQSTYDRDDFVEIVWDNILPGLGYNFKKYTVDTVTDFGVPYDYESVMHYPEFAFSKNGNKTIIPLRENVKIGQRKGLSESDIMKLNKMYCEESGEAEISYVD